jgi:hypothetical protein
MQKLDPALKCDESDTVYWAIPEEVHDKPPIHRSECGAFLCMWGDIIKVSPENGLTTMAKERIGCLFEWR